MAGELTKTLDKLLLELVVEVILLGETDEAAGRDWWAG